jgi:Organic radical activating enzymes
MLTITETFLSIEGEGPFIGIPTFFIRLTGCNLRCEWCDTKYSFYGGTKMEVDDLVQEAVRSGVKYVSINRRRTVDSKGRLSAPCISF